MATAVTELLHRLNGQHYKGEMKDQVPHGEGECTLTDGTVYKGQFYEGLSVTNNLAVILHYHCH